MTQADRLALSFPMLQLAALAAVCASVVASVGVPPTSANAAAAGFNPRSTVGVAPTGTRVAPAGA
jgi:hypothetical protein